MHREPDMGFDPGSPGSRPGPKAGAKPLRHPGIPIKNFLNSTPKETNNPIMKWAKDMNRNLTEEDTDMATCT